MLRSIMVSKYIMVQGIFVRRFPDGRIAVRDGERVFAGFPV
ncbi:hypothetical protein ACS3SW_13380 [Roseobacteraceae bacterium S113]